jgi:hypothetical protein
MDHSLFVGDITSVAGLLHRNFIVLEDERDGEFSMDYFSSFSHNNLLSESDDNNLGGGDDTPTAMISGNNEPKPPGRPTTKDKESRDQGMDIRRTIAWTFKSRGLTRPCLSTRIKVYLLWEDGVHGILMWFLLVFINVSSLLLLFSVVGCLLQ